MIQGWLDEIEAEVTACLCGRARMSVRELAEAMGVSEASALHYIYLLASEGRVSIEAVVFGPGRANGGSREAEDHGVLAGGSLGGRGRR